MARYHELGRYRDKLDDIHGIMHSMKTLAQMETHKLAKIIEAQHTIQQQIKAVTCDFLHFYGSNLPKWQGKRQSVLLIGTERGFCGDFNPKIIEAFKQHFSNADNEIRLIAVGNKLQPLLESASLSTNTPLFLAGANVCEEVGNLTELLAQTWAESQSTDELYAIYHAFPEEEIRIEKLLPAFNDHEDLHCPQQAQTHAPLLNLTAEAFLLELTDHALQHNLHHLLYDSLMAENLQRVRHLENATRHLEQKSETLGKRMNVLRQEEIIEEIEVILLNQVDPI
ncbi:MULTISPECIES: F0F1 ATP synthase subunit gamma [Thiomicrorhabdus]|uniref:F0F1 ATP synthase subunit gamma n=1 Tax=Thiomicrorhabdus heinhorstiae TaxID=2748010 RepID=A0ABS0BV63_9GAMM|nr:MULTISPECIES: F0F1 ATP synthase subunit gamma [Thiomicrorhabdus]MBF6057717.1 F0F1 ATP synthase subunit gamma [Thiomicrorhabdus heinhorstiae]